jgi:hypothetical protein
MDDNDLNARKHGSNTTFARSVKDIRESLMREEVVESSESDDDSLEPDTALNEDQIRSTTSLERSVKDIRGRATFEEVIESPESDDDNQPIFCMSDKERVL